LWQLAVAAAATTALLKVESLVWRVWFAATATLIQHSSQGQTNSFSLCDWTNYSVSPSSRAKTCQIPCRRLKEQVVSVDLVLQVTFFSHWLVLNHLINMLSGNEARTQELMEHRRSSIACTTAAVPPTAGQLVTSERGVCGGPLAFHYANLMSHTAFRQSLACVRLLFQNI
jgi:hypothetical protein